MARLNYIKSSETSVLYCKKSQKRTLKLVTNSFSTQQVAPHSSFSTTRRHALHTFRRSHMNGRSRNKTQQNGKLARLLERKTLLTMPTPFWARECTSNCMTGHFVCTTL